MSYCRAYDRNHEVYLYENVDGYIACCGCKLGAKRCNLGHLHLSYRKWLDPVRAQRAKFQFRSEAIKHLEKHRAQGHRFPLRVIHELKIEIKKLGDRV